MDMAIMVMAVREVTNMMVHRWTSLKIWKAKTIKKKREFTLVRTRRKMKCLSTTSIAKGITVTNKKTMEPTSTHTVSKRTVRLRHPLRQTKPLTTLMPKTPRKIRRGRARRMSHPRSKPSFN